MVSAWWLPGERHGAGKWLQEVIPNYPAPGSVLTAILSHQSSPWPCTQEDRKTWRGKVTSPRLPSILRTQLRPLRTATQLGSPMQNENAGPLYICQDGDGRSLDQWRALLSTRPCHSFLPLKLATVPQHPCVPTPGLTPGYSLRCSVAKVP